MSDPVSNAEIEDVLSSIRRLVSSGDREKPSDVVGSGFESASKLVLTPALRVDEVDESPAEAPPLPAADDAAVAHDRFEFRHAVREHEADEAGRSEDETADTTQAVDAGSQDAPEDDVATEGTAGDDPLADAVDRPTEDAADDIDFVAAGDDDLSVRNESADDDADDETHEDADIAALEDRIAGVEAAVAARDDEWEPDGETDEPYSGSDVTPMAWEDYAPEPELREPHFDDEPDDECADAPAPAAPENGDEAVQDAEETVAASASDMAEEAEDDDADFWSDDADEGILDEAALRDMVSEIVRQELQGALGERITRNVRKLVRREIHRALTSQEFD